MKVIHILYELKFSGAEIMYVDAASLFQEKGCELAVLATAPKLGEFAPYFEKAGYKVLHKPYPVLKHYLERIRYYISFVKYLKKESYDVVHIHSHSTMWGMSLCSWLAGKRSIYTFHSVFPTHSYTFFYHYLLRWSAKHVFSCRFQSISDSVYEHELHFYHNPTRKIYNWYGSNRFYPATEGEKNQMRLELNIPPDTLVLISVGGCNPNKRHSEVINALSKIIEHIPNSLYLHLGQGESEEEEKALTLQLGISEYVRFCGNQTDVRKYLIASDIYLMTSRYEGISITTIEAMACGIPAILYNVQGLRDFNATGENSLLIPEDYRILAEKIIFLYSHPRIATMISFNAQALVNSTFNMKTNVSQIFRLYQPYYEI